MVLLSVNAGSSSFKVSVFDKQALHEPRDSFALEELDGSVASIENAVEKTKQWLKESLGVLPIDITAIGYRVVHGGERYGAPTPITIDVLSYLTSITHLAPNHLPGALAAIKAFVAGYPEAHHVACFDTSFFHDIPDVAKTLPIPLNLQKEYGMRRFGFHGLSYTSLLANFKEHEGEIAAKGRVIMAHLGNGASITACKGGAPLDMSMGFTPISGIMMSTRSGDVEPGVLTYLQTEKGMSTADIATMVTQQSGLLGVSTITSDMRTLLEVQQQEPTAKLAIDLFCYKIKQMIGAYSAVLGGVDSIIFSGGIGERSAEIRERICSGLEFLGVHIDPGRNQESARLISGDSSRVGVHVIPAREDTSIMIQTVATIGGTS